MTLLPNQNQQAHGDGNIVFSDCACVIGASLSEPHTSESNDAIHYYYISVVHIPYVYRLQFNTTACHMRSISNIFALQTTFQHEQCLFRMSSFTMGKDGEERDTWEEWLEREGLL